LGLAPSHCTVANRFEEIGVGCVNSLISISSRLLEGRFLTNSFSVVQNRFRQSLRDFFDDVINQADLLSLDEPSDLEDFLGHHKYSAGVRCIVHVME
jgi:hypothetical protein